MWMYKELLTVIHDLILVRLKRENSAGRNAVYATLAILAGAFIMAKEFGW